MGEKIFQNIDISIIIINYNNCDVTMNCIESILKFTKNINYEIIVVDNNSTECSLENLRTLGDNISFIINNENFGFAKANNQGAKIAKGKFLLFLNNDTLFIDNVLEKIFNIPPKLNSNFIFGCKLLNADKTIQPSAVDFDNLTNMVGESFFLYKIFPRSKLLNRFFYNYKKLNEITEVDFVKGAFLFCPYNTFQKLEGFDERFYFFSEEADLCFRLKKLGGRVYYYPQVSIIHIGGASTNKVMWFTYKNINIAKIKFYQKHYSGVKFLALIGIYFSGIIIRIPLYFLVGIISFNKKLLLTSFYYVRQIFNYPKNIFKIKNVQK